MNKRIFKPGFRISKSDISFICLSLFISVYLHTISPEISLIIMVSVFHFFLFCNVFRISRLLELIWASIFVLLSCLSLNEVIQNWYITISASLFIAGILIIIEMKKKSYHGIFWRKINPNLSQWYYNQENQ